MSDMTDDGGWHLDRRVPIAIIIAVMMQAFGGAALVVQMNTRIDHLEDQDVENRDVSKTVYGMEADIENIKESLRRIETAVTTDR